MNRSISTSPLPFRVRILVGATLALTLALSLPASGVQAGPIVTQGHGFKLASTLLSQDQNDSTGDAVLAKEKISEKILGANCLSQEGLEKGQAVIVTLNDACNDLNDNSIDVVRTNPFAVEDSIGSLVFDVDFAIDSEKKGAQVGVTVPVTVELACVGTVDVDLEAFGIAAVKISSDGCVETLKVQNAVGTGTVDGDNVILEKTKLASGKKSASFVD